MYSHVIAIGVTVTMLLLLECSLVGILGRGHFLVTSEHGGGFFLKPSGQVERALHPIGFPINVCSAQYHPDGACT